MGCLCTKFSAVENSDDDLPRKNSRHEMLDKGMFEPGFPWKKGASSNPLSESMSALADKEEKKKLGRLLSDRARTATSKTSTAAKKSAQKVAIVQPSRAKMFPEESRVSEVGSLIGRAGTAGFGKAVEALDTFGSTLTNIGGGFASGVAPKGIKIGILAFEVANTIVKGSNLKQSLSEEDLRVLKEETLVSEGVQRLVSQDMGELLRIASADKREELKIFAGEVVRFGNHCQDPQWHRLDRIFNKLGTEELTIPHQSKEQADMEMHNLMNLAQYTAELYHELHALDRFGLELRRKLQEEELFSGPHRGDNIALLRNDLRQQQKHVKHLKKRSLWSKKLEEVMGQLVDMVYYLHQEITNAFGNSVFVVTRAATASTTEIQHPKLGASGLSLHYANIINQIDSLVSRPNSVPPNTRDSLYQGLPPSMKASLRSRLQQASYKDELTAGEIRGEMEKILDWLVTVAANTTKAHHGFGWVGEWANTGSSVDRRLAGHTELTLLQTLHHADQECVEAYILELIVGLHYLVSRTRSAMNGRYKSPPRSPTETQSIPPSPLASLALVLPPSPPADVFHQCSHSESVLHAESTQTSCPLSPHSLLELSQEDKEMLKEMEYLPKARKHSLGLSKSQEFSSARATNQAGSRLSKSNSHSPSTNSSKILPPLHIPIRNRFPVPHFALENNMDDKLDIDRLHDLDDLDRVNPLISSSSYRTPQCV